MPIHDDDRPIGHVLSRREVLKLFGGAAAGLILTATGCTWPDSDSDDASASPTATPIDAASVCVVRPELSEGPFFVDQVLDRSDIRLDPVDGSLKEGALLRLDFKVYDLQPDACTPLPGARVDVWHCDAFGRYSGVRDGRGDTTGQTWLRGYQTTGASGRAAFSTVYPGWYPGRAVHIHFKIRTAPEAERGHEFTSQIFFPEAANDRVHARPPYAGQGRRNVLNEQDGIFRASDDLLTLAVDELADEDGYRATLNIALDLAGA
jgi:protocatechuate 3,4-dioxygenase beta subunit